MPGDDRSTVLLQEGDGDLRKVLAISLEQQGWRVLQATSPGEAQAILDEEFPDVLMLELDLPHGRCGWVIDRYRAIADKNRAAAVLLTTDQRPSDDWRSRYRPDAVIYKPYDVRHLLRKLRALLAAGQS